MAHSARFDLCIHPVRMTISEPLAVALSLLMILLIGVIYRRRPDQGVSMRLIWTLAAVSTSNLLIALLLDEAIPVSGALAQLPWPMAAFFVFSYIAIGLLPRAILVPNTEPRLYDYLAIVFLAPLLSMLLSCLSGGQIYAWEYAVLAFGAGCYIVQILLTSRERGADGPGRDKRRG